MSQILLALEKVGITGEVRGFAAILVVFFVALLGGAVAIAAATRNWPKRRWDIWSTLCTGALVFIAVVLSVGKPPRCLCGCATTHPRGVDMDCPTDPPWILCS